MTETLPELREAFDGLFIAPFAAHQWASPRGRSHWVDLEGWQDAMAGPLSAIATAGGCEYVYTRDDDFFASVSDPGSLRTRLLEWHAGLATGVQRFAAATPGETADFEFMRSIVAQMRELIERACSVEQTRWQAAAHAEQDREPERPAG